MMHIPKFPLIGDISQAGPLSLCRCLTVIHGLFFQRLTSYFIYSCSNQGWNLNRSGERLGHSVKLFSILLGPFQFRKEAKQPMSPPRFWDCHSFEIKIDNETTDSLVLGWLRSKDRCHLLQFWIHIRNFFQCDSCSLPNSWGILLLF